MSLLLLLLPLLLSLPTAFGGADFSFCGSSSGASGVQSCSGDIFLKGDYIQVGIHSVGSYGTAGSKPGIYVGWGSDSR